MAWICTLIAGKLLNEMSALYAYISGLGTLFGSVVCAVVIVSMQNYLAQLGPWVTVVQGLVFVVCVMLFRKGVIGEIASLLRKPL